MSSVMHGNEWAELIKEFEASGSGDKMLPQSWVYCITDEEEQTLREKYKDDELSLAFLDALLFDADRISRDYAEECNILLIYPDEDYINRTLEAVGLEGNYVMENGRKRLELFAIAKRTIDGRTFSFNYQALLAGDAVMSDIRTSDDIEVTSTDNYASYEISEDKVIYYDSDGNIISSSDVTSDEDKKESTFSIEDSDGLFFNLDRWRSYYNWCASLTDMAMESNSEANSIEARIADENNELTKIVDAQKVTIECNHRQDGYRPWGGAIGGDKADIRRRSQVAVTVYACHSYKYHCDYYLVQTNTTTTPLNYKDQMDHEFTWYQGGGEFGRYGYTNYVNYLSGYTGSFGFNSYICSVVGGKENSDLSTNEVGLGDYIPTNVPKNKTFTEGMTWSVGGEIGAMSNALDLKITGGVSHSSSVTWTTSDWEIKASPLSINDTNVQWTGGVEGPHNSGWHWDTENHGQYMGLSSTAASRGSLSFKSEWIWQVDKSIWSKQDTKTLLMKVNFFWEEGFCFGEGDGVTWNTTYEWDGGRRYPRFDQYGVVNLTMPKHSWVEMKTFDIDAKGDKSAGLGFSVLSEGNWTVSSDVDWITFTETSGSATGENQYPIRFQVAENNGSPRIGTIKFIAKVGDNLTEETELKVNQAGK